VIAEVLQDDALVGPFTGQFDQGLEQLEEQIVLAEAAGVEVVIDLDHVAKLPGEYQAVDLIGQICSVAMCPCRTLFSWTESGDACLSGKATSIRRGWSGSGIGGFRE
jgi:hypothetical protein